MTNKEKEFPVPRKLRNTAKQSILISGQPDFLYRYKEIKETFIYFDDKKKSLGRLSDEVHLALCDLAEESAINITRETNTKRSPVTSIEGFPSISIQKHKKDTMLVVPAADEAALMEKISKLKELLESKGAVTQERCNWMCVADKGKVQISNDEIIKAESIIKIKSPEPEDRKIITESDLKDFQHQAIDQLGKKQMSSHTKHLRDIALKSIKESKA